MPRQSRLPSDSTATGAEQHPEARTLTTGRINAQQLARKMAKAADDERRLRLVSLGPGALCLDVKAKRVEALEVERGDELATAGVT